MGLGIRRTIRRIRRYFDRSARYDRETIRVMRLVLGPDSNAIDVGANKGDILRHIMAIAPNGRHIAIEALPDLAARLRAEFPHVIVIDRAVSDKAGTTTYVRVENALAYSGLRKRIYDRPNMALTEIPMQTTTIDACAKRHRIAFIKIDIEGGEYHALLGAAQTIANHRPVIIFEAGIKGAGEYGVTAQDIFDLFHHHSYRVSTMRRWLRGQRPWTREQFIRNWDGGPECYFIAYP